MNYSLSNGDCMTHLDIVKSYLRTPVNYDMNCRVLPVKSGKIYIGNTAYLPFYRNNGLKKQPADAWFIKADQIDYVGVHLPYARAILMSYEITNLKESVLQDNPDPTYKLNAYWLVLKGGEYTNLSIVSPDVVKYEKYLTWYREDYHAVRNIGAI